MESGRLCIVEQTTGENANLINYKDSNNNTYLRLFSETRSVDSLLTLQQKKDGAAGPVYKVLHSGNIGNYAATKEYVDSKAGGSFKVASTSQSITISSSYKNLGMHEVSDFVLTVPNSATIVGIYFMAPNCNIQYVHILDNGYEWDSGTDTLRVHAYWIGATNKQWTQTFECKVIYM